jgi:hypothetical protein
LTNLTEERENIVKEIDELYTIFEQEYPQKNKRRMFKTNRGE